MKQGLSNDQQNVIYLNLKEGKIITKEKNTFTQLTGTITEILFSEDEFNGKKYEKAKVMISADENKYCLQMRTDSGYFRGLCNSLKSGNPLELLTLAPNSKLVNDKPITTIFVKQNDKWLKHFHTMENIGDMPELVKVEFKGSVHYDNSNQVNYWKNWANETYKQTKVEGKDDDLPF